MKTILGIFLALCFSQAEAQNAVYVFPPAPTTPVGGIQTVSAIVTGNANKTINWTVANGTASGCSTAGSGSTIGVKSTSTGTCTLTATMAADGTTNATSTVMFEALRTDLQASSTHPRISITSADVTSIRTKVANAGNLAYLQGLSVYFGDIQSYYGSGSNGVFCFSGAGCGTPGPIPAGTPITATAWSATSFGPFASNITLTVSSVPAWAVNNAGITLSGFPGGSCFNGLPGIVGGQPAGTITIEVAANCSGSATESGTLTPSLNYYGWIDGKNTFYAAGGGPFEPDTALYAWMSLVDPTTGNRATWAAHAHDMAMWEINQLCYNAYTGSGPCVARDYSNVFGTFIGSQFILNNREQYELTPLIEALDWVYPTLTTADKATIANLGHVWGKQLTGAYAFDVTDGTNERVNPVGAESVPVIFNTATSNAPGSSNNYSLSHFQALVFLGMLLDPADDPPDTTSCATTTTNICYAPNLPAFQTSHAYTLGQYFTDGSVVQKVTTAGTSGSTVPTWNTTVGGTTTSGGMTSTNLDISDGTAQTVQAYQIYGTKGWLYRLFANFEDQHIVSSAYGLSDPVMCPDGYYTGVAPYNRTLNCTGGMAGGFVAEGTSYGYISMYEMYNATYALYTAGKLNPSVDPQASFISSAYWDKLAISTTDMLYPLNPTAGFAPYVNIAADQFSINANPEKGQVLNLMEVYDAPRSSWRTGLDKWYNYSNNPNGYLQFFTRYMGTRGNIADLGGGSIFAQNTIQATSGTNDGDFASSNPWNPTYNAYDPRNTSTLPVSFENLSSPGGFYHYYGRNNWTSTATQFQFHCDTGWQSHASSMCGRIDYIRSGEPLTTGLGGTTNNDAAASSPTHQNTAAYQWNPTFDCNNASVNFTNCTLGGSADSGQGLYSSTILASSSNATYYYGSGDASGSYQVSFNDCQFCAASANINVGQRDVFWLNPDVIWTYDRAETTSNSSFKNYYLDLQTSPTISGNLVTMTSTAGQKFFITSLLPGTSSWTQSVLDTSHEGGSQMTTLLLDTGPVTSSVRMLHTLEGTNPGGSQTTTTLVQSSSGNNFDGGLIGTTLVMFAKTRGGFSSTTYPASGATTHYVTGLLPGQAYNLTGATPSSATADSGGVLNFAAPGTGNITVTLGSLTPVSIALTPNPVTLATSGTQTMVCTTTLSDSSTRNCISPSLSSTNTGSATVSGLIVTATTTPGSGNINGTAETLTAPSVPFTVTAPATPVSIAITPNPISTTVGSVIALTCTTTLSDATTRACISPVFSSTNTGAMTVSGSNATAVGTGTGNINCAAESLSAPASPFTVSAAPANATGVVGGNGIFGGASVVH